MDNGSALVTALRTMPTTDVHRMQRNLSAVWRRFRYGPQRLAGEAVDSIMLELADRALAIHLAGCKASNVMDFNGDRRKHWAGVIRRRFEGLFPAVDAPEYMDLSSTNS